MGHSCRAHSSYETSSKSHAARLQAFRTRLPPKVTRQVSKTSVSYETSSKSHMSSPQHERFVRDFLKNSQVKVCKTNVSHETSSKSPPSEHTHHAALPSSFAIPAPPSDTRSHANPHVTATFTSTTTHNLQPSRFPAPATNLSASTRLTRTKYCACHEMSPPSHLATSRLPAPATRIALPHLKSRTKYCACHEK